MARGRQENQGRSRIDRGIEWPYGPRMGKRELAGIDWTAIATALDTQGYATLPAALTPMECRALAAVYTDDAAFRSRVVMARHGFGRGEYKYLKYPLPKPVEELRQAAYPPLASIANQWRAALGEEGRFPAALDAYLADCHAAGQTRPTPLVLKYGAGDRDRRHSLVLGE